jgi:uncharacterized protein (TIGR03067 family)
LAVLTATVRCAIADDDQAAKAAAELKQFAGKWEFDSAKFNGRDLPAQPGIREEFTGSRVRHSVVGTPEATSYRIAKLDPSTNPKRITLTDARFKLGLWVPKQKGQVARCIYAIEGGTLTIARLPGEGADFPKSFEPSADNPVIVLTLKRGKI